MAPALWADGRLFALYGRDSGLSEPLSRDF